MDEGQGRVPRGSLAVRGQRKLLERRLNRSPAYDASGTEGMHIGVFAPDFFGVFSNIRITVRKS